MKNTVAVIGLGKAGLPLAAVIADSGLEVVGVDITHFIPDLHLVSDARTAEFIKIVEGCYRDVNIALANEL